MLYVVIVIWIISIYDKFPVGAERWHGPEGVKHWLTLCSMVAVAVLWAPRGRHGCFVNVLRFLFGSFVLWALLIIQFWN